jgi:hypothetical protein
VERWLVYLPGVAASFAFFEDGAGENSVPVEGTVLVVSEVDGGHHSVALPVDGPQRLRVEDLARCLTDGCQDAGVDGSTISVVGGAEVSSSCSGSSGEGGGGREVGAEDLLTVDEDVAEGARLTGVADKTGGSHYRVGESVVVVEVVVVEWIKHFDLAVCDGMSFGKIRSACVKMKMKNRFQARKKNPI